MKVNFLISATILAAALIACSGGSGSDVNDDFNQDRSELNGIGADDEENVVSSSSRESREKSSDGKNKPSDDDDSSGKEKSSSSEMDDTDQDDDEPPCTSKDFFLSDRFCGDDWNKDTVIHVERKHNCSFKIRDVHLVCQFGKLKNASESDKEIIQKEPGEDGQIVTVGDSSVIYIYDGKEEAWRLADVTEWVFGGCTESQPDTIVMKEWSSLSYPQSCQAWYAKCQNRKWNLIDEVYADTHLWKPGEDGDFRRGDYSNKPYVYDAKEGAWVPGPKDCTVDVYEGDDVVEKVCTKKNQNTVVREMRSVNSGYTFYYCDGIKWEKYTEVERETGGAECTLENEGEIMNGVLSPDYSFYCGKNGWVNVMRGWDWGAPKEIRFNPNVAYGTMTDERDGQVYRTVVIGEGDSARTWMAENLNYLHDTSLRVEECFDSNLEHCAETGRYYTWGRAIDSVSLAETQSLQCGCYKNCGNKTEKVRGLCPAGWHLPSLDEWKSLIAFVGGEDIADMVLGSRSGWNTYMSSYRSDEYGFSAFPTGYGFGNFFQFGAHYESLGTFASFWTSSDYDKYNAWKVEIGPLEALYLKEGKIHWHNIRCIKDL